MLERIALHQTRLRTPGLGLDSKGVALGTKGVLLLPSIDRLVALLAVHTQEHSLEDLMASLEIQLVKSKLGTREILFAFAAESSDRMDRIAEGARLVGGFTFTGTNRHFVQYRDAGAPFGYDVAQLQQSEAGVVLYHDRFTQSYEVERAIDLRSLLLRLMPHVDPSTYDDNGPRYLVAEAGLGPALIHYLVRSRVEGQVAVAEWPPASSFDDAPIHRTIIFVPELPKRMRPLMQTTPGITTFLPVATGVAVEGGFRHPVHLRACPVFDAQGLVLLRGRGNDPWVVPKMPTLGDLKAFARVELRSSKEDALVAKSTGESPVVRVPLRVSPSSMPWKNVTASWLEPHEVPLLRRLVYALPRETIARTKIAITKKGAFLRAPGGIEAIPLGTFFNEVHAGLFVPAGYDVTPAVSPNVLHRALGAPSGHSLFVTPSAHAFAISDESFVPLENAILEAVALEPVEADAIDLVLTNATLELRLDQPLGLFALRGAEAPREDHEMLELKE
jgi:hypothetical protein